MKVLISFTSFLKNVISFTAIISGGRFTIKGWPIAETNEYFKGIIRKQRDLLFK